MKPLNLYHRTLCSWLSQLGIGYVEEYSVEPYSLDIFIPDLNRGVEIDGPFHRRKKDIERDRIIQQEHGIGIVRVRVGTKKDDALEIVLNDNGS